MSGKVTLRVGSPYHPGRVTLLGGTSFCLLKPCKRSRLGDPRWRAISVDFDSILLMWQTKCQKAIAKQLRTTTKTKTDNCNAT